MNNYKFSMEKILEWKTNIEKEKMGDFAELQKKIAYEKEKLDELKSENKGARTNSIGEVNILKLQQYDLYFRRMESMIALQEKNIADLENKLEVERLNLVSAQKDRNIMEKLKEKNYSLYKDKINALEQKELDEIAVLRYKTVESY